MGRMALVSGLAAGLAVAGLGAVAGAEPPSRVAPLAADLSGVGGRQAGDPDGSGHAAIRLNLSRMQLCYSLVATGISRPTRAAIRRGEEGDVMVRLLPPKDGASRACVEVRPYEASALAQRPEDYYVTVRTDDFPTGALRGRLRGEPASP